MWAIQHGKHVYCQKPLTHTVAETRMLARAASQSKVATQMGNQGNAGEEVRLIQEWMEDGAIGAVREVQAWTEKPIWPTGILRPTDSHPVPDGMDYLPTPAVGIRLVALDGTMLVRRDPVRGCG